MRETPRAVFRLAENPGSSFAVASERPQRLGGRAAVTVGRVETVIVAYDDPQSATLDRAAELAETLGARLIVTNVSSPEPRDAEGLAASARAKLEDARRRLAGRNVAAEFVPVVGPPGDAIVRLADERDADLIVVGTRKKGFFERLVEGSVNQEVLRRASCDVLVVHR